MIENAIGSNSADTLIGNSADNTLDGRGAGDLMQGGAGNDTYFVDSGGDNVIESASEGYDTVQSSVSFALGSNLEQLLLLGSGNINGTGNSLANILAGNLGINALTGGAGDDIYYVQNTGDSVVEQSGQGTDTVFSTASFALGSNVEHLTLTGGANIDGTGNSLDNTLVGNAGINSLTGGAGNDTYVVQNSGDTIVESAGGGWDVVTADVSYTLGPNVDQLFLLGSANINATGNTTQNVIVGNLGTNTLTGGAGDDIYWIQAPNATVIENPGEGRDTIFSQLTMTLQDKPNVEDLYLENSNPNNATGNALNNVLRGNSAANWLDGQGGDDILIGQAGNDVYLVDSSSDQVIEQSGQGTDTVWSWASFALPANAEHLTLQGSADINGTGNSLDNTLVGNTGTNILAAGAGNDTYVVYNSSAVLVENPGEGWDVVTSTASFTLAENVDQLFLLGTADIDATGNSAQNVIVGNLGTNALTGGAGDDIYWIQAPNSTVIENVGEGRDTIFSQLTMTLPDNVEDLYLEGSNNTNGATGNALDNVLRGNNGPNVLTGLGGNDYLIGDGGVDRYVFDPTSGIDRIYQFQEGISHEELIDLIAFGPSYSFANLGIQGVGNDVHITANGVDPNDFTVILLGYLSSLPIGQVGADDFLFA